MSTLAMALAVTLAAGSAPDGVSGEVEQRLDLEGDWGGVCWSFSGSPGAVQGKGGVPEATSGDALLVLHAGHVTDESRGRCRVLVGPREEWLGIYRQEGDRVAVCFRRTGRPQSLKAGNGQCLLLLHRLKARK